MGMRQITFEVPEDLAERFLSEVPAAEQSIVLTRFLEDQISGPKLTDEQMIAACEALNADAEIEELERDMDALSGDGLDEFPWKDTASR